MNDETAALLENLLRVGTVSSVDAKKRRVRVYYADKKMVSGWLYVLQHSGASVDVGSAEGHDHAASLKYWMPRVNDNVLCLYLPVFNGDGFVLGGIS